MLRMQANKKLLQAHLQQEAGKIVTLRDIHNISAESGPTSTTPADLKATEEQLRAIPGVLLQLLMVISQFIAQ